MPGDDGLNRYTRAKDFFLRWCQEKILIQDERPAIYPYLQRYRLGEREKKRLGFIALGRVTDFAQKIVRPHERTLSEPKADRLRLRLTVKADFGLVFLLFPDPERMFQALTETVTASHPVIDAVDLEGNAHQVWQVKDEKYYHELTNLLADKFTIIADGHHRYQVALDSAKMQLPGASANWWYRPMAFFPMEGEGVTIYPIHRMINNLPRFSKSTLLAELEKVFEVKSAAIEELEQNQTDLRAVFGRPPCGFRLSLRKGMADNLPWPPESSPAWRSLPTSVVQVAILKHLLQITDADIAAEKFVTYSKDAGEVIRGVQTDQAQIGILVPPVTLEQLVAVTERGELLPPKTTFFYPKLLTGLVIHRIEELG